MRWFVLGLYLSVSPALAQWVKFTPCGLIEPTKPGIGDAFRGAAPNLGPFLVWAPSVTGLMGFRPNEEDRAQCSRIYVQEAHFLVIGSPEEILGKLGKK